MCLLQLWTVECQNMALNKELGKCLVPYLGIRQSTNATSATPRKVLQLLDVSRMESGLVNHQNVYQRVSSCYVHHLHYLHYKFLETTHSNKHTSGVLVQSCAVLYNNYCTWPSTVVVHITFTEYKQVKLPDSKLKVSNPMPVSCGQKITVKCPPLHSVIGAKKAKVMPFGKLKWQGKEPTCKENKASTGKKKGASQFRRRKVRKTASPLSFLSKHVHNVMEHKIICSIPPP